MPFGGGVQPLGKPRPAGREEGKGPTLGYSNCVSLWSNPSGSQRTAKPRDAARRCQALRQVAGLGSTARSEEGQDMHGTGGQKQRSGGERVPFQRRSHDRYSRM